MSYPIAWKLRRRRLVRAWICLGVGACLLSQLHDQGQYYLRIREESYGRGTAHLRVLQSHDDDDDEEEWWSARHLAYPTTGHVRVGILSRKPFRYFQDLRDEVDRDDPYQRCERYGFAYQNRTSPRRIYYGAIIANEPWELFEVTATESRGIFAGAVFVEGNRTQNFTPRNASRLTHGPILARLFGLPPNQVHVGLYVNEDEAAFAGDWDSFLSREHAQRHAVLAGWKALGMTGDDLGYLGDSDEIFTRDFYRALQYCDNIRQLDYKSHKCHYKHLGLKSTTLNFEGSPDCPTQDRWGYRPDIFPGACLEEIGDTTAHPKAPRRRPGSMDRAEGYGPPSESRVHEDNITDGAFPLLNGADMRRIGGIDMIQRKQRGFSPYTGYHLHNFFSGSDSIRFKYMTYGHSRDTDYRHKLSDLDADLSLLVRCVHNNSTPPNDEEEGQYRFVEGGLRGMEPPYPIYFADDDYRRARHEFVASVVLADEAKYDNFNDPS